MFKIVEFSRFSQVSAKTLRYYGEIGLLEPAQKVERHPMITEAVSWALREMIKTHREQVTTYLEQNQDAPAGHVAREMSNKLRTGFKESKR